MSTNLSSGVRKALLASGVLLAAATASAGFQSTETFLPAVGRVSGNGGARFYTTVWATNLTGGTVSFTFDFLKQGQSNVSPASFADSLAPGETKVYEDVVESKLGISSALGAARVTSSGDLLLAERIYNQEPGDDLGKTEGLFFAGVPKSLSVSPGQSASIQGVNQGGTENFRYNFSLVETGGGFPTVDIQLRDGGGALLGQKTYVLQPYEQIQPNVADLLAGIATTNARITATVTSGNGSVLLAGAQIADESQDSSGFEMSFPDILAGVASLNGLTGPLTLEAGANVTITPDGSNALRISATVAEGPVGPEGPAGPKGATGATGPQGPPGPVNAVSTDTPNTAALRDGSGNFAMNTLTLDGSVNLPATTASAGILFLGGQPFLHGFGVSNTFVGPGAGNLTMTGDFNTATGASAFASNTSGGDNTADGEGALGFNTTGADNTAVGVSALASNTTGPDNTAVGGDALFANTTGNLNTAIGANALGANTTGGSNTAIGFGALSVNAVGVNNTATGLQALFNNTADDNTAIGNTALNDNTTGDFNTALGMAALFQNTTGERNIGIGEAAGINLTTGNDNIDIGNQGVAAEGSTIRIGDFHQTKAFIAGIRGETTGNNDAAAVVIDSNGQLGTISSSRRYKEDIRDMAGASDRLLRLRPVTFRYKKPFADGEKPIQYGLIAEEVADVFPDLVAYGRDKKPETVKYQTLSSLLLNEIQKQHAKIQDQAAEMALLKNELAEQRAAFTALAARISSMERNAATTEIARRESPANEAVFNAR